MKLATTATLGMVLLTQACTQPEAWVMYDQPVFNKFGEPSCRPPDVAVGGVYAANLPICQRTAVAVVPTGSGAASAPAGTTTSPTTPGDTSGTTGGTDGTSSGDDGSTDPTSGGNGTQNQNQNTQSTQTTTRNTSGNQNQSQSGNGKP
ncbi:MAG: hypothetical protein VX874_13050 [Pseudomonadota bacterium]|nr:hypothetical protein [Pseudomonadota bacterium]